MEEFVPEKEIVSPIDQLLDENNEEPITLYDENDNAHQFDQIAVIPLDGKLYAILVPLFEIEGMADDEALVFYIDVEGEDENLTIVTDEELGNRVFEMYYQLLAEFEGEEEEE